MQTGQKGFRDLLSELDCLRHEARKGRIGPESFAQGIDDLIRQASVCLDPRVPKVLIPALWETLREIRMHEEEIVV